MNGLMMRYPLTIDKLLKRARDVYPRQEIVSRMVDKSVHRYTFADMYQRTVKLMNALRALGIKPGDRVATFAWNHYRHMELYLAVPALGAVLHTLNIRLSPEHISYIVNHAEDRFVFVDKSLVGAVARVKDQLKSVDKYVIMDDGAPDSAGGGLDGALDYETILADAGGEEDFPELSEDAAAALCYTSGTTGDPKGVLYSHRSTFLHAMGLCMADSLCLSSRDCILPVVPMFHVNGWGVAFACCLTGAKVVFPGAHLIGAPIADLLQDERVTVAAGVPSIWFVLHRFLKSSNYDLSHLKQMVVGGSAAPQSLIESYQRDLGLKIVQAWGMTETSPTGSFSKLTTAMDSWTEEDQYRQRAKQGYPVPLMEMRVVDDQGVDQPWDGKSIGELLVRGPWVAQSYYKDDSESGKSVFTDDGWFHTGDIVTIDENRFMEIVDRKKDLIKTRGEWLSSVAMENAVMAHEGVLEAAVIGRPDDVRGEAVVLFVVPTPEAKDALDGKRLSEWLQDKFEKWQIPKQADIHFIDQIPKTSVGKFDKKVLRARLSQ